MLRKLNPGMQAFRSVTWYDRHFLLQNHLTSIDSSIDIMNGAPRHLSSIGQSLLPSRLAGIFRKE